VTFPQLNSDVFLTLEETRDFLALDVGSQDLRLTYLLNQVTADVQSRTNRKLKSRAITTEKYTGNGSYRIVTRQAPIVSVQALILEPNGTAIVEGADRDFVIQDADAGVIALTYGGYFPIWVGGVSLSYTAGFATATFPDDLKLATLEAIAFRYYEAEAKRWGMETVNLQTNTATIIRGEYPVHVLEVWKRYRRGMM